MVNLSELKFFDTTHTYYFKGMRLISVTQVFEKTGLADFTKVKWEDLERARILGDAVHHMARLIATDTLSVRRLDPRLHGYHVSIKKFFATYVKKVIAIEKSVCDPYHGYAGTPDIVYLDYKKKRCLDDFKTPLRPHPVWKFQTAGYKNAWDKCFPNLLIEERAGVMLSQYGDLPERHIHKGHQDFDKFLLALGVAKIKIEEKIKT